MGQLVLDGKSKVGGFTLIAAGKDRFQHETAVYLPPTHAFGASKVNVILWLHGHHIPDVRQILDASPSFKTDLREGVLASKKDVVLVAPYLGYKVTVEVKDKDKNPVMKEGKPVTKTVYKAAPGTLDDKDGTPAYLKSVLDALAAFRADHLNKGKPAPAGGVKPPAPTLELGNLIIACHSGGGWMMRDVIDNGFGSLKPHLKECWGFDCLYDGKWTGWTGSATASAIDFYVYFGDGSGDGGKHAFDLWKNTKGTTKPPLTAPRPKLFLAPGIKGEQDQNDADVFMTVDQIKASTSKQKYVLVRKRTDPLLERRKVGDYWTAIRKDLMEHSETVRVLLSKRIARSRSL